MIKYVFGAIAIVILFILQTCQMRLENSAVAQSVSFNDTFLTHFSWGAFEIGDINSTYSCPGNTGHTYFVSISFTPQREEIKDVFRMTYVETADLNNVKLKAKFEGRTMLNFQEGDTDSLRISSGSNVDSNHYILMVESPSGSPDVRLFPSGSSGASYACEKYQI